MNEIPVHKKATKKSILSGIIFLLIAGFLIALPYGLYDDIVDMTIRVGSEQVAAIPTGKYDITTIRSRKFGDHKVYHLYYEYIVDGKTYIGVGEVQYENFEDAEYALNHAENATVNYKPDNPNIYVIDDKRIQE